MVRLRSWAPEPRADIGLQAEKRSPSMSAKNGKRMFHIYIRKTGDPVMPMINPVGRHVRTHAPVALSGCLIAACTGMTGHSAPISSALVAPTNEEVVAYVQTHWSSYSERTARFQQRPNDNVSLIGVRDVSCGSYYGIPECRFTVTVSIDGGSPVDQRLSSQFDRYPDGKLFETIVLIHERRW